jgi:serine protease
MSRRLPVLIFFLLALVPVALASGQPFARQKAQPTEGPPTDQIIIKFESDAAARAMLVPDASDRLAELSRASGESLTLARPMSGGAYVLRLDGRRPVPEVALISAALARLPGVAYAEPDLIKQVIGRPAAEPLLVPNDTLFSQQWHYGYVPGVSEGLNLVPAWNISTGSAATVVAVIDTGILNHADLAGKTVAGYDFIGDTFVANDGDGRDNDPSDPGDWIEANECGGTHSAQPSSWHGTHVAGTIGAATNNGLGVAGVNWLAKILPVRVLGKCGGYTSDIVDGVRWAAGLSVTDVPANANPAKVLNLSLGGPGLCSASEQTAFNDVIAAGASVVIAAGNSNDNAANYAPGNCNGVITVAATDRTGDRAFYSNYGATVEISAPGGETATLANGVLSTLDGGVDIPLNNNIYAFYQGTSMAAPHIAGLASLMLAVEPNLTPAQVGGFIQANARAFPAGSGCTTTICGSGIADAYATLQAVALFSTLDNSVFLPTITKPEPPPPPSEPLKNPGFESGPVGWTEFSSHGYDLILEKSDLPADPHSGNWAAWLAGDDSEVSSIAQNVTIPSGSSYLTYYHWIVSDDVCGFDVAGVLINDVVPTGGAYYLCSANNTGGWVKFGVDLAQWAGQLVELKILAATDGSLLSHLLVDDVALGPTGGAALPALPQEEADEAAARLKALLP